MNKAKYFLFFYLIFTNCNSKEVWYDINYEGRIEFEQDSILIYRIDRPFEKKKVQDIIDESYSENEPNYIKFNDQIILYNKVYKKLKQPNKIDVDLSQLLMKGGSKNSNTGVIGCFFKDSYYLICPEGNYCPEPAGWSIINYNNCQFLKIGEKGAGVNYGRLVYSDEYKMKLSFLDGKDLNIITYILED